MIGVVADAADYDVVREFFELFKTPWEFRRRGRRYEVLLCAGEGDVWGASARLGIIYAADKVPFDDEAGSRIDAQWTSTVLTYRGSRLPIYGRSLTFRDEGIGLATADDRPQPAAYAVQGGDRAVVRIGYDLFREVRTLLTAGQPSANAGMATLELHIALLRDLIVRCGIPLVEIPPVPDGHRFIACLTHDVDHPSLRRHTLDRTMFGFLYRACIRSVIHVCRGRAPVRALLCNWAAALKLPLVHLGLAGDFWQALDRYVELERGVGSTFFVIPAKADPGMTAEGGRAPSLRAARYEARDIAGLLGRLLAAGSEIGVHGIDAWVDSARGRDELERISRITGAPEVGIRMHWLFFDERSPAALEKAGFSYDSTVGYNDTVGYRAGTTQAYRPLDAVRLLELPLHVMDTALFYRLHLDLPPAAARQRVHAIVADALRFGGVVTINWHDRSIAPERLWGGFYVELLEHLRARGAWFATAHRAVAWFRKRRSAVFEAVEWDDGRVRVRVSVDRAGDHLPGLRLRVHTPRAPEPFAAAATAASDHVDIVLNDRIDTSIPV